MAQIAAQKCEFSCDEVAVLYCKGCDQFLCIECRQNVHDRVRKFKDHEVVDIHKEGNRVRPNPVCETHKNQFLYYCSKCECLTCAECMTSSHNEHRTETIKNVADARRQNVDQIIENLKTKVETVKNKLETIDTEHSIQVKSDCESYVKTVEETVDDLHKIVDRHKIIPMTTASDFKDIENEDLRRKRVFFRRRHDETADRLLKFENLLQETHDSTFLTEWKGLQTVVKMNDEETDDPLMAPRRIESFNQKKLTRSVIDEIDEKFQMRLSLELKEMKTKVSELIDENDKLNTEIKERKVQEFSKLQEQENKLNKLEKDKTKLKEEMKVKEDEIGKLSNEVDTQADLTKKLTIYFEDKIKDLESKLKQSEKKNTAHNYSASEGREEFLLLWPSMVKFKTIVKTPNEAMTEKQSLKQIPIAAFQFLVLENSTLKEQMKTVVDKSFQMEYDSNEMKVKFFLQANSRDEGRTMITTMGEELNKLVNRFTVKELPTDQTRFRFLLCELKRAKFKFVQRNVHVYCQDDEKFVIVGQEQLVEEIFTMLARLVSPTTQTSATSCQTVQLGIGNCNLFGRLKGKEGFQNAFPQIKIEILADSVEIIGPIDQASACAEEVKKWPSSIKSGEKHTNKHIIQLLEMQEVREYVEKYIHGKGINCVYTTLAQKEMVKIFAFSDQAVNLGFTFLHECTMEKKVGFDNDFVFADLTFENLHEKYAGKKMIYFERDDCTVMVATNDVMLEFYEISRLVNERVLYELKKNVKHQEENNTT